MIGSDQARQIIDEAIRNRVFPAAAIEVGDSASVLWTEARGTLTFDVASPPAAIDTPFDLASLTKVIATTTVVMDLVRAGALRLDERVASFFVDWRGADRDTVTVQDLLEHASGLSARLLDPPPVARREFEHDIGTMPLEYAPRSRSVYSDLGFILLGFLAADRGGAPLADLFERIPIVRSVRLALGTQPDRRSPGGQAAHFGLLHLCGCGCPDDAYNFCRGALDCFDRRGAHTTPPTRDWINAEDALTALIQKQPNIAAHVLAHLLSHLDLLEHGGSVGGSWLTPDGERIIDMGPMTESLMDDEI